MPIFLQNWLESSRPNYCLMFIHAWIPFNAWFRDEFYDTNARNGDRELIDRLKTQPNKIKNRIIALLLGQDEDAVFFKSLLSKLNTELNAHAVHQNGRRVGLNTTCIADNTNNNACISSRGYDYKCIYNNRAPRGTNRVRCEVMSRRSGVTKYLVEILDWTLEDFHSNPDFQGMDEKHRVKLEECFMLINPKKPEEIVKSVIPNPNGTYIQPHHSLTIDTGKGLFVVNDTDKVSQVIIQLLYNLRCAIFHGEVEPTSTNMGVYEPAFHILNILNQELI